MGTPAVTLILNEVGARLAKITTANGYNTTLNKIERARLIPFVGYDLPTINYWVTGVANVRDSYNYDERTIRLFVEMHDLTHDEPFIDVANRLAADVITVLNRATSAPRVSDPASYELGEIVRDLVLEGFDYEIGEGQKPFCGVLVRFLITYICTSFSMEGYGR
jgi:hypothetical protein